MKFDIYCDELRLEFLESEEIKVIKYSTLLERYKK